MKLYKIIREKVCTMGAMFNEYSYQDINQAYQICAQYTNYYCCSQCGCQFAVKESEGPQVNYVSSTIMPMTPIYIAPITYTPSCYTWIPTITSGTTTGGQWTITSNATSSNYINSAPITYTINYT